MRELDPSVKLELDVYWAIEAGEDPIALMRKSVSYTHLDVYKRQGRSLVQVRSGLLESIQRVPQRPRKHGANHVFNAQLGGIVHVLFQCVVVEVLSLIHI